MILPPLVFPVISEGCVIALALARVVSYAPRVMLQIVASLTDDSRGIIYDRNMFIAQANGLILHNFIFFITYNKLECITTLCWKGLPVTNTLAYRDHLKITKKMNCCEYQTWAGIQKINLKLLVTILWVGVP